MSRVGFVIIVNIILILSSCQEDNIEKEFYGNKVLKKEIFYENGVIVRHVNYSKSGELDSDYEIKDGKKEGKATIYFIGGGKKAELFYKSGVKHGECILYNKDGSVFEIMEFKEGKLVEE